MIQRQQYIKTLLSFKDSDLIKIVTGVRRCGKSTLLELYRNKLIAQGVEEEQIQFIQLEALENEGLLEYHKLYEHIVERLVPNKQNYIFLDEIQTVPNFEKAVRSLYDKKTIDLYLTGSNSKLQSGQWATSIAGRYVEIKMYPLSFKEFVDTQPNEARSNLDKLYATYISQSAFPYTLSLTSEEQKRIYLEGIYETIVLKDVVENKGIRDVSRLKRLIRFMASCIGSEVSPKKISDTLQSEGHKIAPATIEYYLEALTECFIFYKADRFDVKGKKLLKTLNKYYFVDMGLRHLLLGNKGQDKGHILENIVYLELLRRGYKVSIGKNDLRDALGGYKTVEIDFVAENKDGVSYFQVAENVTSPETLQRELIPLKTISDHCPKFILTRDYGTFDYEGIKQINVLDWLVGFSNNPYIDQDASNFDG